MKRRALQNWLAGDYFSGASATSAVSGEAQLRGSAHGGESGRARGRAQANRHIFTYTRLSVKLSWISWTQNDTSIRYVCILVKTSKLSLEMPCLYVAPALPEKGGTRAAHANISTTYRNGCSTAHSLVVDRQAVPECQCLAAYCVRLLAMGVRHSRGQDAGRAVPVDWVLASGAGLAAFLQVVVIIISSSFTYLHSPPLVHSNYTSQPPD